MNFYRRTSRTSHTHSNTPKGYLDVVYHNSTYSRSTLWFPTFQHLLDLWLVATILPWWHRIWWVPSSTTRCRKWVYCPNIYFPQLNFLGILLGYMQYTRIKTPIWHTFLCHWRQGKTYLSKIFNAENKSRRKEPGEPSDLWLMDADGIVNISKHISDVFHGQ